MNKKNINGWLNINKPIGMTSARVVAEVKRCLGAAKVGHAGTLDPLASGVLPLALGEATKTVSYAMLSEKEYKFTVCWGASTTTDDLEGDIFETSDKRPSAQEISEALKDFVGEIEQTPPVFSAIKVDGKRSYDLARGGQDVQMKARKITIHSFSLLSIDDEDHATFHVRCGKGTYVRSLGRDLAERLGTKGHISYLQRVKVGKFEIKDAILLETMKNKVYKDLPLDFINPVENVLDDIPVFNCTSEGAEALRHGRKINCPAGLKQGSVVSVRFGENIVALADVDDGFLMPRRVFNL